MNLPHPLDRQYQNEAYQRIANSDAKYVICRLATGLGKTAIAANLAVEGHRVLANVMTKSLQWQYTDPYQFTELFGKGNYICGCGLAERGKPLSLPDDPFTLGSTADMCEMGNEGTNKSRCQDCDYNVARKKFVDSQAGIINYSKFLSDRPVVTSNGYTRAKAFDPDILVFDEAHELADEVVKYSGLNYNWSYKRLMEYCESVQIPDPTVMPHIAQEKAIDDAIRWTGSLLANLKGNVPMHPSRGGDVKLWRWHKHIVDKIDTVAGCLDIEPECWHVHADNQGITIRPKTAKYHFKPLFQKANKIVMMSATISAKDIEALGISDYEFIAMPNPIPARDRPVYDLNCPTITHKSTNAERKQHAQIIADWINKTPDYWVTLVLFPSKNKSEQWADWLYKMTRRPVFVPQRGLPTDRAYADWLRFKDANDGAICVAWQFWTGIDAGYFNTVIVGDIPFPDFSNPFEVERFNYNKSEARNRIANKVEQGNGRNRRGHKEHYGPDAEKLNLVCGGSKFKMLRSAFQKDFWESVI